MKEIINETQGLVKAIIKKITGSYNEDIEQEVYIKTWLSLSNYKDCGKMKAWVATIASNICKDYFKSSLYRQNVREITSEDVLQGKAVAAQQEKMLDVKKRQKIILKAIDNLPSKMRKVVILHEFEDMTIEKIAQKLGEPTGTIKSRLYGARKILTRELKDLQGE